MRIEHPEARNIFYQQIQDFPWIISVYENVADFEMHIGNLDEAEKVLWLAIEKLSTLSYDLILKTVQLSERLGRNTSHIRGLMQHTLKKAHVEIIWKFYCLQGSYEARHQNNKESDQAFAKAEKSCPPHLLWKVHLQAAHAQMLQDKTNVSQMRTHCDRALVAQKKPTFQCIPQLVQARYEECQGDLGKASALLANALASNKTNWRPWFESIWFCLRNEQMDQAIKLSKEAVLHFPNVGKLNALAIQCCYQKSKDAEIFSFYTGAVAQIPKSGELLQGYASFRLNSKSAFFNLEEAARALKLATHYTPQFGDSFIELMRLELIKNGEKADFAPIVRHCMAAKPGYGLLWNYCQDSPLDTPKEIMERAQKFLLTNKATSENEEMDYLKGTAAFGLTPLLVSQIDKNRLRNLLLVNPFEFYDI